MSWRVSRAETAPAGVFGALLAGALLLAACEHRIQVEAPKEPIVINLNIKIEQEILVKIQDDVNVLIDQNDDLF